MADKQQEAAPELVCFTIIVDDLVFPDGVTAMAQLGGGGPQTLFGFQLAAHALREGAKAQTGLAAGIGPDFPPACMDWLRSIGVDTRGLVPHARPTPRAWQVFEEDGRRTQVWRGAGDPCDELYSMMRPRADNMPPHFLRAPVFHIGIHPLFPPLKLLRSLRETARANGGWLCVEPYTAAERPATEEEVQVLLRCVDLFSPAEAEAVSMVGPGTPLEMAHRLLEAAGPEGARVVVVRCGPAGAVAAWRADDGTIDGGWQVPAVPDSKVVDVCGAGNSFCGGFLAALAASHASRQAAAAAGSVQSAGGVTVAGHTFSPEDIRVACVWGCAVASHMVEERGVPHTPLPQLWPRAQQRARELMGLTQRASATSNGRPVRASASATAAVAVSAAMHNVAAACGGPRVNVVRGRQALAGAPGRAPCRAAVGGSMASHAAKARLQLPALPALGGHVRGGVSRRGGVGAKKALGV